MADFMSTRPHRRDPGMTRYWAIEIATTLPARGGQPYFPKFLKFQQLQTKPRQAGACKSRAGRAKGRCGHPCYVLMCG